MSEQIPAIYETESGLRLLANYLRSPYGIKNRSAIEHEKRVDYFKGKRFVECLIEAKKWPKTLPKITDRSVAAGVAQLMIKAQYFHRSEKVDGKKGNLVFSQKNFFEETGYYTWMFAGNMVWSNVATAAVIAIVIGFTLLPVWPDFAKKILWYISVTFLIVTLIFILIRLLLFLTCWVAGYEFWVFPRLFDESLTFQESFKPVYTFDKGTPGQGYYRLALLAAVIGFMVWAYQQPTEFDGFLKAQKEFIDDLYSGNLLADVAHDPKLNIDRSRKVPNLEDLLREIEEIERVEASAASDDTSDATTSEGGSSASASADEKDLGEVLDREAEGREEEDEDRGDDLIDKMLNDDAMAADEE